MLRLFSTHSFSYKQHFCRQTHKGQGGNDDCSMPEKGYYYRMDNDYPWALDIPSSNNSLNNLWRYPIEGKGVSEAYPDYLNWTSASGHHINWLDKQNSAYIY